jgi:predicted pyridoxine 5'-phosphate oxidase superfamily flavin-nucleotide-binding protein
LPERHDRTAPSGDAGQGVRAGGADRPGSEGERRLQRRLGTAARAERFYEEQVLDHLNERMREFVQRQEMFFLATADGRGECDSSFRAGPPGFLQVIDERTLVFPEYRGNGVHASLGNIEENPHLGIMLIDFTRARIGLHVNGRATIVEDDRMRESHPHLPEDPVPGRRALVWVRVEVEEAYIHCAKHIPQLQRAPKRTARDWGTDDYKRKGGDFFGAARESRESEEAVVGEGAARDHAPPVKAEASPAEAARDDSVFDELPGYDREETHAQPATASADDSVFTPLPSRKASREAEEAAKRESLLDVDNDSVWQVPEMPPPPQMPSISLGQGAAGPLTDSSLTADSVWPSASDSSAADGASGALAARGAFTPAMPAGGEDPADWRQQAERALAEAQRRGSMTERGSFQGWFG